MSAVALVPARPSQAKLDADSHLAEALEKTWGADWAAGRAGQPYPICASSSDLARQWIAAHKSCRKGPSAHVVTEEQAEADLLGRRWYRRFRKENRPDGPAVLVTHIDSPASAEPLRVSWQAAMRTEMLQDLLLPDEDGGSDAVMSPDAVVVGTRSAYGYYSLDDVRLALSWLEADVRWAAANPQARLPFRLDHRARPLAPQIVRRIPREDQRFIDEVRLS